MLKNLALIFVAMLCWQTATYAQSFDAGACPTAVAIPDNDPAGVDIDVVTSGLSTTLGPTLILEQVNLQITHTWNGDADITLTAPDGITTIEISTDNGGSGDNYGDGNGCTALASFNMSSVNPPVTGVGTSNITGTFLPEGDFADFNNGLDPNGTWTLNVADDAGGDVGTVEFVELVFAAPPACPAPSSPTVTAITTTSVDLGWTQGGTVSSWDIEWDTVGFTQGTGTMVTGTTTNPHSLTGLMANTTYEFYVRANCGSAWIGPLSFTTACNAFVAPYTESFDGAGTPACWSQYATTGGPWLFQASGGVNSVNCAGPTDNTGNGGNYAWMDHSGGDAGVVLEMNDVDVSALTVPYLEFNYWLCGTGYTPMNPLFIEAWDGAAWNVVTTVTQATAGWELLGFSLVGHVYNTNLVRIRFRAESGGSVDDYYGDPVLDDVSIKEAPTCIQPSALTVTNITATSVDLGWTSAASLWDVEWDTVGFTQGTGTMVTGTTTNPHNLTGLMPNTTYSFYVRADCGAVDGVSTWNGPFTFTTTVACPDPTNGIISNITSTSADLSWTQTGGISSWDVEWDTVGFTQGTGTMVTGTTTNPHNLTGLMANTTYSFYVRANCGSGWAGPFTFTTACNAFVAPYLEEFAVASLPSCWTTGGATTWEYGSIGGPGGFADYGARDVEDHSVAGTGTFIGMDGSDNSNGEVSTLLSPFVDVSALTTPELSYWVFSNNINDAAQNKLIVELYDGAAWNVVDSIQANLDTAWVEFTTNLTAFTITGDVQVRFTVTGDNSMGGNTFYNDILIDDVALRNAPLADLVISEIMYNTPGVDTAEFIEIYNNGTSAVDLTGYTFGLGVAHTFTSGSIAAGDYFVITMDTTDFNAVYGFPADDQWTSGNLVNSTEDITLVDGFGRTVDSVRYDDGGPNWPTGTDGQGASIVLCDANTDNNDGANWSRSYTDASTMISGTAIFASPGTGNNCTPPGDVEMTEIFTMMTDYCGADSVDVYMVFTNNTSNTEANVPFVGTINGTGLPFVHALAPNAVDTVVGRIPTPVSGVYNLGAWTALPGDANMSNDTAAMITIYVSHLEGTATVTSTSNYNGADISCNGANDGEATVAVSTAGLGTVGYMWVGNGSTTMVATGLSAGMATAVLTDSIGCVDSAMVTLTEPTLIMPTVDTVMNVTCNGANDGAIMLTFAGGTGAYTYAWDNGATVEDITGLAPNTYNGTVTDANGCILTTPAGGFTITEPSSVTATATDDATGNSATAAGSGGTVAGAYTFMWDAAAGNQTTATATGLTSGNNYCVTITDDNGCASSACVTVLVTGLDDVANANAFKVYPNPTTGNVFVELSAATTENVQVDLFNATGQNVLTRQLKGQSTRIELNTGELPTGVYMMRFAIENEVSTQKLIIQRP
ncbi:MAG: T9SS type A sorting domain-containing protein [Aureispira sp.]|nr:T9SS type A sorting domain-containing protein [Aureispira sp.]